MVVAGIAVRMADGVSFRYVTPEPYIQDAGKGDPSLPPTVDRPETDAPVASAAVGIAPCMDLGLLPMDHAGYLDWFRPHAVVGPDGDVAETLRDEVVLCEST